MDEIEELTSVFKALADPTRLRLVKLLSECDCDQALCVNALAGQLGVTQSAVSQHLRVLRGVGLVHGDRRGNHVHYAINRDRLARHRDLLRETLGEDVC